MEENIRKKSNKPYKKVPIGVSIHLRYLHQDMGKRLPELCSMYKHYSKTSIFRHMKLPVEQVKEDGRIKNDKAGRKKKVSERDGRKVVASLKHLRETVGYFSSTDVQRESGVGIDVVSNRTLRRHVRSKGYRFSQCRRKGQLSVEDEKKRLKFARKCSRLPESFWCEGISFYLDGTGWVHKTNPAQHTRTLRTRTWKKPGESLHQYCTAKGKKEGVGGKMVKLMVAISHKSGVIKCHQYDSINAEVCASFIKEHFPDMFKVSSNRKGKLFLQDGDPSQNSRLAIDAMDTVGCRLFKIPPRSPDLNPIENVFHLIGKRIHKQALAKNITKETYLEFSKRSKANVLAFSADIIDRTIESMPRRVKEVIKVKGRRTKY